MRALNRFFCSLILLVFFYIPNLHAFGDLTILQGSSSGTITIQSGGAGSMGSGDITDVNAGYGITVENSAGPSPTVNLKSDTTSYIQNRNTLQSGATFYVSSGTIQGQFRINGNQQIIQANDDSGAGNRVFYSTFTQNSAGSYFNSFIQHAYIPDTFNRGAYVISVSTTDFNFDHFGDSGIQLNLVPKSNQGGSVIQTILDQVTTINLSSSTSDFYTAVNIVNGKSLRLNDADNSAFISLESPSAIDYNQRYIMPISTNSAGKVLTIDNVGTSSVTLNWTTVSSSSGNSVVSSYGSIYTSSTSITQTGISTSTFIKATIFDHNGISNQTIPDFSNSQIAISSTGAYNLYAHISVSSTSIMNLPATLPHLYFEIRINGSSTGITDQVFASAQFATLAGQRILNQNDVVALYVKVDTATAISMVVNEAQLIVGGIGGAGASGNLSVITKTSTYTITDSDDIILSSSTSTPFTLTLPTAVGFSGDVKTVKKIDGSTNPITINTTSSQTIDSITSFTITTPYVSYDFVSDNSNWWIK